MGVVAGTAGVVGFGLGLVGLVGLGKGLGCTTGLVGASGEFSNRNPVMKEDVELFEVGLLSLREVGLEVVTVAVGAAAVALG